MRKAAWLALLAGMGGGVAAEEKAAPPDPALPKAVEAIETASRSVQSLQADYVRTYTVFGRSGKLAERGKFYWRRSPEGAVQARWEGADEKGPVLFLVRDRRMTIWRGQKREAAVSLDAAGTLHPSRFNFPLLPSDWKTAYRLGGPRTSPDFDDRLPEKWAKGIPSCLTFAATTPEQKLSFSMVSLSFDEETGLAYHLRMDSPGWTMMWLDLGDWTVNPKLADALFEPPVPAGSDPPAGAKEGAPDPGKPPAAPKKP